MGHYFFDPSKWGGLCNFSLHIRGGSSPFPMQGGGHLISDLYFGVSQFLLFQR